MKNRRRIFWLMETKLKTVVESIDIAPLLSAFTQFQAGLKVARSDLEKAGVVQYFKFTYELAWKTMKWLLMGRGKDVHSPKNVFRDAALEKFIEDPEVWFSFQKDRNETVHTYNPKVAQALFVDLPRFEVEMVKFLKNLQKLK